MDKIETIHFHQEKEVSGIKFWAYNAGHVLGAAMFMIEIAGVNILYTGDLNHISMWSGLQGSAACFPSPFRLVTLDHLRNYHKDPGTAPHNRLNPDCFKQEDFRQYKQEEYMNIIAKDPKHKRKNGRNSHSIIGQPLHPFEDGQLIIEVCMPPGLHCVQGVFLKLFIKLRVELSEGDEVDDDDEPVIEDQVACLNVEVEQEFEKTKQLANEWKECVQILETSKSISISGSEKDVDNCEAVTCIEKASDQITLQCVFCSKAFHASCEGKIFEILKKKKI